MGWISNRFDPNRRCSRIRRFLLTGFIFFSSLVVSPVSPESRPSGDLPVGTAISAKTPLSWQLNHEDDAFLEELAHRDFRYFWDQADPHTGLILDRIRIDGSPDEPYHRNIASIASTGFGLTALAIIAKRTWITKTMARDLVRTTLRFFPMY